MNSFQNFETDAALSVLVEDLQAKLTKATTDNAKLLVVLDDRKRKIAQLEDHIEALSLDLGLR